MSNMADGLNFAPRVKEPESSLVAGMAAPSAIEAPRDAFGPGVLSMPDTSGPGSVAAPAPAAWVYDYDPGTGSSRATYNGEVTFTSGGSGSAGVTTWNTRSGPVVLTTADITGAGGALNASPVFTGTPAAPTQAPGDSSTKLATTAFVAQAIVANPIVQSFNGRTGPITLTSGDVTNAGGAPAASPALTGVPTTPTAAQGTQTGQIASTQFVANAIASGAVTSWNGRQGPVSLTLSDVQSVGGAPVASPTFTGTPAGTTAAPGTATTQLATTAFVTNALVAGTSGVASFNTRTGAVVLSPADITNAGGAPLASPVFTGNPAAPTPTAGDASTKLATTAFVGTAIASLPAGVTQFNGRTGIVTLQLTDVTSVGGAPLASPVFTGTPQGTTATPGDNSIRLATTAFVTAAIPVVPAASATTPIMDGTATAGLATAYARGDHIHPTDTTRYAASNPSGYQTAAQVTASLGNYLPLAGGTLSGNINANGGIYCTNAAVIVQGSLIEVADTNARIVGRMYTFSTSGDASWDNNVASTVLRLDAAGNFLYTGGTGNAAKISGGSWTAISDARIKTEIGAYAHGLEQVMALRPVIYQYKGNDCLAEGEPSMHRHAAEQGTRFVGLAIKELAQRMEKLEQEVPIYIGPPAEKPPEAEDKPIEWRSAWSQATGWIVVGKPQVPVPTPA